MPDRLLPSLLLAAFVAAAPAATAQLRVEAIADSVLRPYSLRDAGALPAADPVARAAPRLRGSAPQLRDYSWLGGAVQVESSRIGINGTYTRPKVVIGVPSDTMKDWMSAAGLTAEQCLLPMVRARARISPDGEASGAFWLYARCSFQ